jgi:chloride channel 2
MSGQYWKSLGDYAKEQAAQLRQLEKKSVDEAKVQKKELQTHYGRWLAWLLSLLEFTRRKTFVLIGGDWVFLALLGILMAILSFTMDLGIYACFTSTCSLFIFYFNIFKITDMQISY